MTPEQFFGWRLPFAALLARDRKDKWLSKSGSTRRVASSSVLLGSWSPAGSSDVRLNIALKQSAPVGIVCAAAEARDG
jgi:hypothetical protein